ncbi:MAG: carotene hydroxylase [Thermoflexibacter sp.]|jgi:beta-carotene 3-hydroxylase|nr:carotene hydroxylase [Thermoflexibacter sp.]
MNYLINIGIIFLTFCATELIAWALHKYIMHGFLWSIHASHHVKDESHFFEWNDLFFLFFAIPSALCIYTGIADGLDFKLYIGIGILIYGIIYFVVHDVFIHQRYPPILRKSNHRYFRALRRAHHAHHKHIGKQDGEAFGLLWVSKKYFEKEA